MGGFASEQEVYDGLGVKLAELAPHLRDADTIVQYRTTDPTATLTIDARAASTVKIDTGDTELNPEIVLSLTADRAAQLLSGDLEIVGALASGEIAGKGPVGKLFKVLPAAHGGAAAATEVTPETPADETVEEPAPEDEPVAEEEPDSEAPEEPVAEEPAA